MPEAFACAVLIASKLSEIFDGSMICCPGQSPILCINRLLVGNHVIGNHVRVHSQKNTTIDFGLFFVPSRTGSLLTKPKRSLPYGQHM